MRASWLVCLLAVPSLSEAAPMPVDGGSSPAALTDEELRSALARCGPGDALGPCIDGLRALGVTVEAAREGPVRIALGGSFAGVSVDGRGTGTIADVAFTAGELPSEMRGSIASFLELHAGAYPFSEACSAQAPFCGVLYPKQGGGALAVEIGLGLVDLKGAPAWKKPPAPAVAEGIYRKDERLLDVQKTPARALVVQFSLPVSATGERSKRAQLLRPAFERFARSPFVRVRN